MEVKNGLITFYGFYPSLNLCSPLKKERPKHATREGILPLPPAEFWNGRNVECYIAWRRGIYVETRRATSLQAAMAPFVFPYKSAPIR